MVDFFSKLFQAQMFEFLVDPLLLPSDVWHLFFVVAGWQRVMNDSDLPYQLMLMLGVILLLNEGGCTLRKSTVRL